MRVAILVLGVLIGGCGAFLDPPNPREYSTPGAAIADPAVPFKSGADARAWLGRVEVTDPVAASWKVDLEKELRPSLRRLARAGTYFKDFNLLPGEVAPGELKMELHFPVFRRWFQAPRIGRDGGSSAQFVVVLEVFDHEGNLIDHFRASELLSLGNSHVRGRYEQAEASALGRIVARAFEQAATSVREERASKQGSGK